ncbi:MAG: xanthine dehydrogenase family protein subunit M [Alphaproteobacteria bacterium]|nr:xanthine dehydrogenase family protein subunit M [Alphaproteobacteria bacterium]
MKPAKFEYHAPASVDEAIGLLARYGGEARVLAGGQSLIPMMNFRVAAPAALIDLNRIPSLAYIRADGNIVRIGAMTRQRAIEFSAVVREKLPLLHEAVSWVGHLPTRSRGTIGGSLAHADPAAELPMALQAMEGEVVARGPTGERTIKAGELFTSSLTTTLKADEILTEIRFPASPPGAAYAVEEFARRHGDFAITAIACLIVRDGPRCKMARLATGGVGPVPLRLRGAEAILEQRGLADEAIDAAAAAAAKAVDPMSDHQGSAEYRRHLTQVLTGRAIHKALARAS